MGVGRPTYETKTNKLCKTEIIIKFRKITINYKKKFLKIFKPTPNITLFFLLFSSSGDAHCGIPLVLH